jgi:hypothetical protein
MQGGMIVEFPGFHGFFEFLENTFVHERNLPEKLGRMRLRG